MLWDNTGDAGDVVNAYAELFGDGTVMDSMRKLLTQDELTRQQREDAEYKRLAAKVAEERVRRRFLGDLGVAKEAEIPDFDYHRYAGAFNMKAKEEGIELPEKGYECWQDDDFLAFYRRKHPYLFYEEAARNARIVVEKPIHRELLAA